MSQTYDVVIIGGGPGGYNCAIRAGQLGLKTACIEMRDTLGGTCLNVGCIPSKALLHASELYETAEKDFAGFGIKVSGLEADLAKMMGGKAEAVKGLTDGVAFLLKKNKVDHIRGKGRIAGKGKVEVDGPDGKQTLETKHIVIATGSEVTPLPGVEIDEEHIVSSTGALELKKVPEKLVLIGAGVIGLELGSVWRRLGADVTVIEYLDRILPGMDSEIAKQAQRIFKKQGMAFELSRKVTGIEKTDAGLVVATEAADGGKEKTFEANVALVCIGRRPYTDGLGLETVGIETDKRGFIANDHYKTSADGVWVIGDCTHGPMLAHKAEDEGVACAERIAGKAGHVNYGAIPGVVYTNPEIACVGATEDDLKSEGRKYKTGKFSFMANSRARANHETDGMVKLLADAETDELLGAHMIGKGVGEMISELCLALEFRAASEDIARTSHPHPTMTEAIRQAAMGVEGWTMQA
ncbi:dihydrolipoyl dehydrogenase [Hyphobacterium sp. HN65]|uniref:Dihydrolipoyl dehydrogenase n=1 Tax=Hyphobacterium lacteum TaxID=3116575 RepID=A0ABU7LSL0_9PROT|nr:dihydrolipoyl dehydrogenase [Hyphobacterium sp. HN65]MEE2526908.1 dihydrolipoyl dehydrogenase [Hyphobacterium sp. HN65]